VVVITGNEKEELGRALVPATELLVAIKTQALLLATSNLLE